jgi:hypothetical protein
VSSKKAGKKKVSCGACGKPGVNTRTHGSH